MKRSGRRASHESSFPALVRNLHRHTRGGAVSEAQFGSSGPSFAPPPRTPLALFELTETMYFPTQAQQSVDPDNYPWPKAQAKLLCWLAQSAAYAAANQSAVYPIYFPAALRDGSGNPVGVTPLASGHRCVAWFNGQAGRWEAIVQPPLITRFEMKSQLTIGSSASATALGYDRYGTATGANPPGQTITVYDAYGRFSKMATTGNDTGAYGFAQFFPDRNRWEILDMETPCDFWGEFTAGPLANTVATITVHVASLNSADWLMRGYNPFQTTKTITVYNPPAGSTDNGVKRMWTAKQNDYCYCRWDPTRQIYWILFTAPNNYGWTSFDVVTRTSVSVDFVNQTYTHHYFTKQIQLPPWVTIGSEVQH